MFAVKRVMGREEEGGERIEVFPVESMGDGTVGESFNDGVGAAGGGEAG